MIFLLNFYVGLKEMRLQFGLIGENSGNMFLSNERQMGMRFFLILLFFITFCSCSGNKEKFSYSKKDVVGTYYAVHPKYRGVMELNEDGSVTQQIWETTVFKPLFKTKQGKWKISDYEHSVTHGNMNESEILPSLLL